MPQLRTTDYFRFQDQVTVYLAEGDDPIVATVAAVDTYGLTVRRLKDEGGWLELFPWFALSSVVNDEPGR